MNYGLETVSHSTAFLWESLPNDCKFGSFLGKVKQKIKDWKLAIWVCWLFQVYPQNIGGVSTKKKKKKNTHKERCKKKKYL